MSFFCIATAFVLGMGGTTTAKDFTSAEFVAALKLMQDERELTHGDLVRAFGGPTRPIPLAFWEAVFGRPESRSVKYREQEIWTYVTRDGQVTLNVTAYSDGHAAQAGMPYLYASVANSTGFDTTPPNESRLKRSLARVYATVSPTLPPDSIAGKSWADLEAEYAREQAARDAKNAEEARLAAVEIEKQQEALRLAKDATEAEFDYVKVYRALPYGDAADALKAQETEWRERRAAFFTEERHAGRIDSDDIYGYSTFAPPTNEELEAAFLAGRPFPVQRGEAPPSAPPASSETRSNEFETGAPMPADAPFDAETAREIQRSWAKHLGVEVEATLDCGMTLVLIPPGSFVMGDDWPTGEGERQDGPPHRVILSRPYWMSAHEVTVAQYRRFVDATGHPAGMPKTDFAQSDDHPIAGVNWNQSVAFCEWLSTEEGRTIRLPTEAEWEYACRGGTETPWYYGSDHSEVDDYCWYMANSEKRTHPVGSKQPNGFGLFDMHGNVREWCADWYVRDYAFPQNDLDPAGPAAGDAKVLRSGCYDQSTWVARSSHRNGDFKPGWSYPGLGFRVVAGAE